MVFDHFKNTLSLEILPLKQVAGRNEHRDFSFMLAPLGSIRVCTHLNISTKSIVFVNITNFVKVLSKQEIHDFDKISKASLINSL